LSEGCESLVGASCCCCQPVEKQHSTHWLGEVLVRLPAGPDEPAGLRCLRFVAVVATSIAQAGLEGGQDIANGVAGSCWGNKLFLLCVARAAGSRRNTARMCERFRRYSAGRGALWLLLGLPPSIVVQHEYWRRQYVCVPNGCKLPRNGRL
jgi:hypothetical protein